MRVEDDTVLRREGVTGRGRVKVLIVDDDPGMRRLGAALLEQRHFIVRCASSGAEGLAAMRRERFHLALLDWVLPRMDGPAVLAELRADAATASQPVAFLTAKDPDSDSALAAARRVRGVVGTITKPFDPERFGDLVGELVGEGTRDGFEVRTIADGLVQQFLVLGLEEARKLLSSLNTAAFDRTHARYVIHRWVGRGGTFGHPQVTDIARELEALVDDMPASTRDLRAGLSQLEEIFDGRSVGAHTHVVGLALNEKASSAHAVRDRRLRDKVPAKLHGARIAVVGFDDTAAREIVEVFEWAGAFGRIVDLEGARTEAATFEGFDLIARWVDHESRVMADRAADKPLLWVGTRQHLRFDHDADTAADFVVWPAYVEELVLRAHRLLRPNQDEASGRQSDGRTIVIADDDPTVCVLLDHTLTSYEFTCHTVDSGTEALELARQVHPAGIVLDVNMPGMSGFEVLSHMKGSRYTKDIPVVMLSSRGQESDVLRGFSLGADDYVVKPFSPMELVARLKRALKPSGVDQAGK